MPTQFFLYLIIVLEGYVVLSAELLALRLLIPFVGNATDTVAVVIAAVLMPLAFGYYVGGRARSHIRRRLLVNLTLASVVLVFGLSYAVLDMFFGMAQFGHSSHGRLLGAVLYAVIFLVLPVFWLGQTVPLVSHYFRQAALPATTGKILFFSTLGSFMGAVFCTIVLMPWIGVHHSASITIFCLTALIFLLARRIPDRFTVTAFCAMALCLVLNSDFAMARMGIVSNNQYNTVEIASSIDGSMKFMRINNTHASAIYTDPARQDKAVFGYIQMVEDNLIAPLSATGRPHDILVIGGGGMTVGLTDMLNNYIYLDIDPALESIARDHMTQGHNTPNKRFVAEEARAYLARGGRTFDLIFLDIYQDRTGVPSHTITREFFEQLKLALKPDGIVAANIIAAANFNDAYAIALDQTIRGVFPLANRQVIGNFNAWNDNPDAVSNIVYVLYNKTPPETGGVYRDLKNRSFLDKGRSP